MFVFDTSAFINGWRDHYPAQTFPSVWRQIDEAMGDGRITALRAVYAELTAKDDDVALWAKERAEHFVEASAEVQRRSGEIVAMLPNPGLRDQADPFVVAEAEIRELAVVTYEGRTFSGVPTRNWHRTMPGICRRLSVDCRTLPEALTGLGASF